MNAYIDALPAGLDSYPEFVQKASIYREFLVGVEFDTVRSMLPNRLRAMLEAPVPVTAWVTEVEASALFMALRDAAFADDQAYFEHVYRSSRRLMDSALYRLLFRLLGPRTVLRGAHSRWGLFHRGVEMSLAFPGGTETSEATITLRFPPHLFPRLMQESFGDTFRAAAELSGARAVAIRVASQDPEHVALIITWE
jgi:hypothetical protein